MDTSKLAQRLERLQNQGGGGKNIFFKSTEEKQKVRLVPYPHDSEGFPFIEVYFHYNVAGYRSLVCPQQTHGENCPICDLADEFRNMGGKDNFQQFRKFAPKLRTYSPIIVRGDEEAGIKLWGYGKTIYEELIEKFMEEDWGNLSDPKTGRDLTVWSIPAKSAANDSDYIKPKMDVSPNQTALAKKKADVVKLLEGIPDYLNDGETFAVRTYEELQDIISKLSDVEDEVEDDDVVYSTADSEDKESNDDSDILSKLGKFLDED